MNRRKMLGVAGMAGAGFVVGTGFTAPACSAKDLSGWVVTVVADYGEIKTLLPGLGVSQAVIDRVSGLIDKAVQIAKDFDDAYKARKFDNAITLFTSLGGLITQVAGELGVVDNRILKLLLVGIQIARITIASLLKVQADTQPAVAAKVRSARMVPADQSPLNEIERLASIDVSRLLSAIQ
jgi:hypothetical protein